jgi:hypothetical protein
MKTFVQKNWTLILAAITALWGVFGPSVQAFISGHPKITVAAGVITAIIAHVSPSPIAPTK